MNPQKVFTCFVSLAAAFCGAQVFAQTYQYPFQKPSLPLEERVANVIFLLNQTEKIQLPNNSGQNISRLSFTTTGQEDFKEAIPGISSAYRS